MKLIRHVIFIFFILNNLIAFAYTLKEEKRELLLYYAKHSGHASSTCKDFSVGRKFIHAYCRTKCSGHSHGIFSWCYWQRKKRNTKISLDDVAMAKKSKKKIRNINGSLKIRNW